MSRPLDLLAYERPLDLLALGDPCLDLVYAADRLPGWDDKVRGESIGQFGGGTEANAACTAARLGWRSALWGRVGDDPQAESIRRELAGHGVQLDHLRSVPGTASSTALVALSPQGERSVVWLPPTDGADDVPPDPDAALARSRWAYTMPYAGAALVDWSARSARCGTRLAIDVEREGALRLNLDLAALMNCCDLLFLNRSGFETVAGTPPEGAALQRLQALCRASRARTVVVTLGAQGAIAADRDEGLGQQPAEPVPVLDVTGAGDCFNATFLVARDRGARLGLALAQAGRSAALCVSARGARGALQRLQRQDAGPAARIPTPGGPTC